MLTKVISLLLILLSAITYIAWWGVELGYLPNRGELKQFELLVGAGFLQVFGLLLGLHPCGSCKD